MHSIEGVFFFFLMKDGINEDMKLDDLVNLR
jgi:hypothetical protein